MSASSLFDKPDGPPNAVLLAVAGLAGVFAAGSIYLVLAGPFTGIVEARLMTLPEQTAVVEDYQGPVWGVEAKRSQVARDFAAQGLGVGDAITIYQDSPQKQRPLQWACRVGFLALLGSPGLSVAAPLEAVRLPGGGYVQVVVKGRGNYSGFKALRAAERVCRREHLKVADRVRFEIKRQDKKANLIEHEFPVSGGN